MLKENYPEYKKQIKTHVLPDFLIRLYGIFNKPARSIRIELGCERTYDNSLAKKMFNWKPRSNEEAILSMADSMIRLGVV